MGRDSGPFKYELAGTGAFKSPTAGAPVALVVDDDADMVKFVGAVLQQHGITVVGAYDAIQGLALASRQHPRVILIDWHMPAGGGAQLLRKLQSSTKTREIPVLVITADAAASLPAEATLLGARGVLQKPLDANRLAEAITSLLG
jgi:two-component system chemotaxis response regulator CheY